jgi:uncharacterized protein YndB with AHSA1/START domain
MSELKHFVSIEASPAKVYAAIATQTGMRNWWTADTVMDEKVGGNAEFGFGKRETVFRMVIKNLESEKKVVMKCRGDHPEWKGTTLTWKIVKEDTGTALYFTHSGWKKVTGFCASCNSMWGNLMYRLKDYVEGKHPGPQWKE